MGLVRVGTETTVASNTEVRGGTVSVLGGAESGCGPAEMELGERTDAGVDPSQGGLRTAECTSLPAPTAGSGPATCVAVGGVGAAVGGAGAAVGGFAAPVGGVAAAVGGLIGAGTVSILATPVLLSWTISGAVVRGNGPTESAQVPGSTSGAGVTALAGSRDQDSDSVMQVDPPSDKTEPVPTPLSNGTVTVPTDQNHEPTPMEVEPSCPALVSSPRRDPIVVRTAPHLYALLDHRRYCKTGTWEGEEREGEMDGEMDGMQTDEQNEGQTEQKDSLEPLTQMLHDFLESFYLKYGSFIPLSEADVLEHLKNSGDAHLLKNRKLDIPGELCRYKAGLASAPAAGFMVTYNKHTLSMEDLSTLEEQNWLNDQVINTYGELIMEATQHKVHFFNSFFHRQLVAKGYEGVKRWTKKVDLFSKSLLLVPIHLEIHWSLISVDMATKTINYYDSQGIVIKHTIDNILKYLQSEAKEKKQTAYQKGWKMLIIKGIPQQKNDSDCGVFVLEYCRCLAMKQGLRFSQNDMPLIRKRIYKELCDKRLNV